MRKTLVGAVSFVLAAVLLSGCGLLGPGGTTSQDPPKSTETDPGNPGGNPPPGGGETDEASNFPYKNGYIADHLDPNHSITYETHEFYQGTLVVTYTHTSSGGYYIGVVGKEEHLFIKNGDTGKYDTYEGTAAAGFKKTATASATQEEVDKAVGFGAGLMSWYVAEDPQLTTGEFMKLVGSETVIGRDCDKFVEELTPTSGPTTNTYWIDKATGVLLKYTQDDKDGHVDFVATEFKTGNGVTLPDHD